MQHSRRRCYSTNKSIINTCILQHAAATVAFIRTWKTLSSVRSCGWEIRERVWGECSHPQLTGICEFHNRKLFEKKVVKLLIVACFYSLEFRVSLKCGFVEGQTVGARTLIGIRDDYGISWNHNCKFVFRRVCMANRVFGASPKRKGLGEG